MGNNRGNKYSRAHNKLNPNKDKKFWHYTFHEMGMHDLPAMIDHIIQETGREKISYVGHSQGTAQLFAAATIIPEYFASKLNGFVALGPITNIHNIKSLFFKLLADSRLDYVLQLLGVDELLDSGPAVLKLQELICKYMGIICSGLLEILVDLKPADDDMDRFLVLLTHFPSGTSLRTLQHFADNIRHNRFCQYDNSAPYVLENIKGFPISLFVGKDDELATPEDCRILRDILTKQPGVLHYYNEFDDMGHATFFLSKQNDHVPALLGELDKYNS
jgi:lysosomal acid lipase/cholesteryl ester hydrolase